MLKQDYIMRIIHEMVRTMLKLLFNIDEYKEEIEIPDPVIDKKCKLLCQLADSGHINEAENQLFAELDTTDLNQFEMGLLFFDYINNFTDEELEQADYSREEINEGLKELIKEYDYESLGEALA